MSGEKDNTSESILKRGREVIETEAAELTRLAGRIDNSFAEAVELIYSRTGAGEQKRGKVVLTGIGKSGLICQKIAATLASTGTPALFVHPTEGMHGDLGIVLPEDVALIVSYSGETAELLPIIPSLRRIEIPLIAMTGSLNSSLAKKSDIALDIGVEHEACALGLAPTSSTTVTLALGDALAVALLDRRGFTDADFARLHPGGSIGMRLTVRVSDVMHAGAALPLVEKNEPLSKVIPYVSEKRLGVTGVVDENKKLIGVLTDGDIRRAIEKLIADSDSGLLDRPVTEFMGAKPKFVEPHELIGAAINICEKHSITALFVLTDGEPVGIVHLHDLLKA